jgi:hypothetical protein
VSGTSTGRTACTGWRAGEDIGFDRGVRLFSPVLGEDASSVPGVIKLTRGDGWQECAAGEQFVLAGQAVHDVSGGVYRASLVHGLQAASVARFGSGLRCGHGMERSGPGPVGVVTGDDGVESFDFPFEVNVQADPK